MWICRKGDSSLATNKHRWKRWPAEVVIGTPASCVFRVEDFEEHLAFGYAFQCSIYSDGKLSPLWSIKGAESRCYHDGAHDNALAFLTTLVELVNNSPDIGIRFFCNGSLRVKPSVFNCIGVHKTTARLITPSHEPILRTINNCIGRKEWWNVIVSSAWDHVIRFWSGCRIE